MIDRESLHELADGRLDPSAQAALMAELETNAALRAEYNSILSLKSALKRTCEPVECAELWKTCRGRLDELDRANRVQSFVTKNAWALCGVFAIAIVTAGTMNRISRGNIVGSGDVAQALSGLSPFTGAQSNSNDVLTRIARSGSLDVEQGTYRVTNSSEGVINGRMSLRLSLRDDAGNLELMVIQGASVPNIDAHSGLAFSKVQSLNSVAWSHGNDAYFLLGDRSDSELQQIANQFRGHPN